MDPSSRFHERRRDARHEKPITANLYDDAGGLLDEGIPLRDVCLRGMGFDTVARLDPREELRFHLRIPGEGLIAGKAQARWIRPSRMGSVYHCGVEITGIGRAQSRILRRYLEPSSRSWIAVLDFALLAATALVCAMVWRDLQAHHPGSLLEAQALVRDWMEWLPASMVSAGALLGLTILFRRR